MNEATKSLSQILKSKGWSYEHPGYWEKFFEGIGTVIAHEDVEIYKEGETPGKLDPIYHFDYNKVDSDLLDYNLSLELALCKEFFSKTTNL